MKELTDQQIQKKLEQIVKLSHELDAEAKRRYGSEGNLFCEADGGLYLMDGDEDYQWHGGQDRQAHIKFRSVGTHRIGVGAW